MAVDSAFTYNTEELVLNTTTDGVIGNLSLFSENDPSLEIVETKNGGAIQAVDGNFYTSWQTKRSRNNSDPALLLNFNNHRLTYLDELRVFWSAEMVHAVLLPVSC